MLSGGERTRLAVARMLLRPSNTLLLDEPTNHLDLDSKEVLLDALVDYGGTLIFVSHDRYFVERLATKIIEVGDGTALVYPGTYAEFLWHKEHPDQAAPVRPDSPKAQSDPPRASAAMPARRRPNPSRPAREDAPAQPSTPAAPTRDERKRTDAEAQTALARGAGAALRDRRARSANRRDRARDPRDRADDGAPGFYDDRAAAQPVIDRHQALMWEVGDLMHRWEELQQAAELADTSDR